MALGFLILQPPFLFLLRLSSSANSYVACFLWRTSMNSMENVFGSFSWVFFFTIFVTKLSRFPILDSCDTSILGVRLELSKRPDSLPCLPGEWLAKGCRQV